MQFVAKRRNRLQRLLNRVPVLGDILRRPLGFLGFLIILGFLTMVVAAPLIAPRGPEKQDVFHRLEGPSASYLFGTDHLGRDLFARIVFGSRIAVQVALPAVAVALVGGAFLGLLAGYLGGIVDDIVVVYMDSAKAFPAIILALAILAVLGQSLTNEIIVIGFAWIPNYARVARAQVLSVRQNLYVQAEQSLGAGRGRILTRHILPNILAPLLILAAMDLPVVITVEAGLSFLGLGVRPPTPSWGVILSNGFENIFESQWPIAWAGLTLIITTLGFTLFGETLRDVLDPRLIGTRRG
jgi:peptide/nickel transport system permease protein